MTEEEIIFTCSQCPKIFATRSNLKRHMENPNIHNIPYARSRDQKRWKGHSKKVSSRAETTERMRKWRAENRDKNKKNDLRCRVYRLARQKFGEQDSEEKQQFINDEINRRLNRRISLEELKKTPKETPEPKQEEENLNELPFYCAPLHKIELPSINMRRPSNGSLIEERRNSNQSTNSSIYSNISGNSPTTINSLPPMQSLLNQHHLSPPAAPNMSYSSPKEQQQ